jgi:Domain of unknown function (DUF5615)
VASLRFALDEGVSHPLASLLRSQGWDIDSAKELGRLGLRDVQVLLRAVAEGQTHITHNGNHFYALHEAWVTWRRSWSIEVERVTGMRILLPHHAGILIAPQIDVRDLVPILEEFGPDHESIADRLFVWSLGRQWQEVHVLP